jgi:hypothetical protein
MSNLFYLIGVTCSGKDYVIQHCMENYPDLYNAVQVGNIFRQRYSPDFFKGQGAPNHTETEALEIYFEELQRCNDEGKLNTFICGQPRRLSQISKTIGDFPGTVIWLHCNEETQQERMYKRFKGDQDSFQLACDRVKNDRLALYDVVWELNRQRFNIVSLTSEAFINSVDKYGGATDFLQGGII